MAKLFYQGHGSLRIITNDGVVIYVDPYLGEGYDIPADLVLCSHAHHDHTRVELIMLKDDGVVLNGWDMTDGKRYDTYEGKGVKITAVPACNKNHPIDKCVGFVIEVDGVKVYLSCDTSKTEHMQTLANMCIDYAFFCCDGIYNMTAEEASECAAVVKARHNVPYHTYPENLFSEEVAKRFIASGKLTVRPSEEIELKREI